MKQIAMAIVIAWALTAAAGDRASAQTDPWTDLQKIYKDLPGKESAPPVQASVQKRSDPWHALRSVFVPFSVEEEAAAVRQPEAARKISQRVEGRLGRYHQLIKNASTRFDVPQSIVKSVILAESGGDPAAKASTTTAKGLMQTIDSTFRLAQKDLLRQGIIIKNDPLDPHASIMAGTWYLDRMYKKADQDGKIKNANRNDISTWRYPLEYYYAGPANGRKTKNKILVFSKGTRRIIDKRAYSKKVQKWAKIMDMS